MHVCSALKAIFFVSYAAAVSLLAPSDLLHITPRAACSGNTASTRSEWCDYSIDTDYSSSESTIALRVDATLLIETVSCS
jgi:hypothetical protein